MNIREQAPVPLSGRRAPSRVQELHGENGTRCETVRISHIDLQSGIFPSNRFCPQTTMNFLRSAVDGRVNFVRAVTN